MRVVAQSGEDDGTERHPTRARAARARTPRPPAPFRPAGDARRRRVRDRADPVGSGAATGGPPRSEPARRLGRAAAGVFPQLLPDRRRVASASPRHGATAPHRHAADRVHHAAAQPGGAGAGADPQHDRQRHPAGSTRSPAGDGAPRDGGWQQAARPFAGKQRSPGIQDSAGVFDERTPALPAHHVVDPALPGCGLGLCGLHRQAGARPAARPRQGMAAARPVPRHDLGHARGVDPAHALAGRDPARGGGGPAHRRAAHAACGSGCRGQISPTARRYGTMAA